MDNTHFITAVVGAIGVVIIFSWMKCLGSRVDGSLFFFSQKEGTVCVSSHCWQIMFAAKKEAQQRQIEVYNSTLMMTPDNTICSLKSAPLSF